MVVALAALLLFREAVSQNSVAEIDRHAKARDADGMRAFAGPAVQALGKPFFFLKANGPYDTGRFGWTAISLKAPSGASYVVFSTKITSEDYGEFLFEFDGEKLAKYCPEPDPMGYRIEHQDLDVWFDLPAKTAILETSARIARFGSSPAARDVMVRLSPHYRVSKVTDAAGNLVPFAQAGGVVAMQPMPAASFVYKLHYRGVVDLPRYAGSITAREALLTNDYWYPMIARLPATYQARIHTPPAWTGVAQGELAGDIVTETERITTWKMDLPVTYWSLSAAAYRSESTVVNGRTFRVWSLSMSPEQMKLQAELSAPILEFYDATFGRYPFSFWGAVDSPQYGGGALEAYSFATYGTGWLPDSDSHEPAHTWWGGMINNTYFNSLWNESFASYCGGLYDREGPIGNQVEKRLAFVSDAEPGPGYDAAPMAQSGVFIGPAGSSLGYGRGAAVLQMLEVELGPEKMMSAMRHWIQTHPKGKPGEWEDFEKAAGASSGANLKTFFDEWVRRPGWVDFELEKVRWANGKVLGEAVFKSEPYHLLCEVLLQSANGSRSFAKVRFEPVGKRASFSIDCAQKPALVSFDPWRRILRRKAETERPAELAASLSKLKRYVEGGRSTWANGLPSGPSAAEMPTTLDGTFWVGSPETMPKLKPLFDQAGFRVQGSQLTYDGTTIDLQKGGAVALLDLPGGGRCAIGIGRTRRGPNLGRARLAVYDDLGRFLRGKTDPKTQGALTFKL